MSDYKCGLLGHGSSRIIGWHVTEDDKAAGYQWHGVSVEQPPSISIKPVKGLWGEGYSLYNNAEGQWLTKPIKNCTYEEAEAWLKSIGGGSR